MNADRPRIVARRRIYKGWNSFDILTVEATDADGTRRKHEREIVDHGDAAVVLAIDRGRGVAILVRQWRPALLEGDTDPYLLEACAGLIDPGETPEDAARREALEETGLTIGRLRKIATILPAAGTFTERMHLFVAEVSADDRRAQGGGNPHEGERIEIVAVPLKNLFAMARRGEIEDAKTLVLVQALMIEALEQPGSA